jgi:hypothetical protein
MASFYEKKAQQGTLVDEREKELVSGNERGRTASPGRRPSSSPMGEGSRLIGSTVFGFRGIRSG